VALQVASCAAYKPELDAPIRVGYPRAVDTDGPPRAARREYPSAAS